MLYSYKLHLMQQLQQVPIQLLPLILIACMSNHIIFFYLIISVRRTTSRSTTPSSQRSQTPSIRNRSETRTPDPTRRRSLSSVSNPSSISPRTAEVARQQPLIISSTELMENWEKGRCNVKALKGHKDAVLTVQLVRNSIVSSSRDMTVRIWDVKTGHCLRVLQGHEGPIEAVVVDGLQRKAYTGSWDTSIKVS